MNDSIFTQVIYTMSSLLALQLQAPFSSPPHNSTSMGSVPSKQMGILRHYSSPLTP